VVLIPLIKPRTVTILAILIILTILPTSSQTSHPSQSVSPPSSLTASPFPANIYKVATELKAVDKGDVSVYYQALKAGWQSAGYNAALFSFCSICDTITPNFPLPRNGGFDTPPSLDVFASDGLPFWTRTLSSSSPNLIAEENLSPQFISSGPGSFHSKALVSGNFYGWSGISQDLNSLNPNTSHNWIAPLTSNLVFTGQLRPEQLTIDQTNRPDSLIVFEFDMSYWNQSSNPTRMFFVYHNQSVAGLDQVFPQNDTNTRVYDLTQVLPLKPNQYNSLRWNLTDYAIKGFGYWHGIDNTILTFTVQSWSRNSATSEFYLDALHMQSTLSRNASHAAEEGLLSHYNSTSFPLISGVTDFSTIQDLNWFGTTNYPVGSGSISSDISTIESGGGYPFISAPYLSTMSGVHVYNVTAVPVWSDVSQWAGTGTWVPGGLGAWDQYLTSGIPAVGYVQQHAFSRDTIRRFVSPSIGAPATFVYADSLSGSSIIESMAQGRSFGQYTWMPLTNLYFAAENDVVSMGRFPIFVSQDTNQVILHIRLSSLIPQADDQSLGLRIISNGAIIDDGSRNQDLRIRRSQTSYDKIITERFPAGAQSAYYRFELYSLIDPSAPMRAFSNPIFFTKVSSLDTGLWLAETPDLSYGAAKSYLSDVSETSSVLQFKVNALGSLPIVTTIHSQRPPLQVVASHWQYDAATGLLSVTTIGTESVKIFYASFDISIHPSVENILRNTLASATITIQGLGGFSSDVKLTTSISPSNGLSCVLAADTLRVDPNHTTSGTALLCNGNSLGNYVVNVTGSSGITTRFALIRFNVQVFTVSSSGETVTLLSGETANSTIAVSSQNDFMQSVSMTASVNPNTGLTCSLSRSDIAISGNVTLSCKGAAGNYNVTVTGTSVAVTSSTIVGFKVQDFNVQASRGSITTDDSGNALSTIIIVPVNGFAGNVTLSFQVSPTHGLSCSLSRNVVVSGSENSILACKGAAGSYMVTITGRSGSTSRSTSLSMSLVSKTSGVQTILLLWPYIVLGGAATMLAGLVLNVVRKK
jgi:hypothetical protein